MSIHVLCHLDFFNSLIGKSWTYYDIDLYTNLGPVTLDARDSDSIVYH